MVAKTNIWQYAVGMGGTTSDKIAFKHPAVFPEKLAYDHILSWSNKGDLVFDPMCGSGTTCKMAAKAGRRFLGVDISQDYIDIAMDFAAYLISPTHKCVAVGNRYFGTSITTYYKALVAWGLLMVVVAGIFTFGKFII
jgi:DNA modification methylase